MKPQQTEWIVYVVDVTGMETKVDFVLSTKIPEEKLKEILYNENQERCFYGLPPLCYEEFAIYPKTAILAEAERQYARDEGVGKSDEFKNFVREVLKEQRRSTSGVTSTITPPSPEQPQKTEWIRAADWAKTYSNGSSTDQTTILRRLSKAREGSVKTGRKYKGFDIYKDKYKQEYYKVNRQVCFYKKSQLEEHIEILVPKGKTKKRLF